MPDEIRLPAKQQLLAALLEKLRANLAEGLRSQRAAQTGATHEETRAEDPKDTRSTEASYLARGLAARVETLNRAVAQLESFRPRDFAEGDAAAVGALVVLEDDATQRSTYWIVPIGGGETLEVKGARVRTLTPPTPLGQRLCGCRSGDGVLAPTPGAGGSRERYVVVVR